jgi:predicted lipid-binding transport protein (Tim44 family)
MAERRTYDTYVERRTDDGTGLATGMVLGIVLLVLLALVALFFVFGGPSRFAGGTTTAPNQTNINVPAQQQPSAPNINVPPRVDVNVNPGQQAPAPQQPSNQQPAQPQGSGQSGSSQSAPAQPAAPNR